MTGASVLVSFICGVTAAALAGWRGLVCVALGMLAAYFGEIQDRR